MVMLNKFYSTSPFSKNNNNSKRNIQESIQDTSESDVQSNLLKSFPGNEPQEMGQEKVNFSFW